MAAPALKYPIQSFAGTAGPQMDQNFKDLILALTDGTADLTLGSITTAKLTVNSNANVITATIKQSAGQTADLFQVLNSSSQQIAYIDQYGALRVDWQAAGGKTYIGRLPADSNYGGIWFSTPASAPTASNYHFLGDPSNSFFNASTNVFLRIGNTTKLQLTSTGLTVADGINILFNTTTGTKLGTSATQKLGFYNATPIVQPSNTTDLRTALINLGLYATGGASPLNLNGGAFTTSGVVTASGTTDATSNSTGIVLVSGGIGATKSIYAGGDIACDVAGKGFKVKEGSNAKMGTATLTAGTVTVSTTAVTANSRIFLTTQTLGGVMGDHYISARSAGTSFTITSTNPADTSTLAWILIEPS